MKTEHNLHNLLVYAKSLSDEVAAKKSFKESMRYLSKKQNDLFYKIKSKQNNIPTEKDFDEIVDINEAVLRVYDDTIEKLEKCAQYIENNLEKS